MYLQSALRFATLFLGCEPNLNLEINVLVSQIVSTPGTWRGSPLSSEPSLRNLQQRTQPSWPLFQNSLPTFSLLTRYLSFAPRSLPLDWKDTIPTTTHFSQNSGTSTSTTGKEHISTISFGTRHASQRCKRRRKLRCLGDSSKGRTFFENYNENWGFWWFLRRNRGNRGNVGHPPPPQHSSLMPPALKNKTRCGIDKCL